MLEPALAAGADHAACLSVLLDTLAGASRHVRLAGVGHRIVHGGPTFAAPTRIDDSTLAEIESLGTLAPHHQPHNVAAIRAVRERRPDLAQVACFDTAFHANQPPEARRLPLPVAYEERGIKRYGFHGLSFESIIAVLPGVTGEALPRRLVVAHLGNGGSLCAIRDGQSVATTMGFSTLDGVPMGTRSGSIDPGVLLHLLLEEGLAPTALHDLLYNRSGLLGVSGLSADMRELLASRDPRAAAALRWYGYRVAREIGSLAAALEGLDALVFTGGIGLHAAPVRLAIMDRCRWLGLEPDADANAAGGPRIATPSSRVTAWVVPTDEEAVIARHTWRLIR